MMHLQRTLVIIKPDAWPQHGGAIITMATEAGLVPMYVTALGRSPQHWELGERFYGLEDMWSEFYVEHKDKPFFKSLIEFMASGTVLVMVLEGEGAIAKWRALMGPTDSRKAGSGTVRGRFGDKRLLNPPMQPTATDALRRVPTCSWHDAHTVRHGGDFICKNCDRSLTQLRDAACALDENYPMWRNAVHGSDSPEAAAREIDFFFGAS